MTGARFAGMLAVGTLAWAAAQAVELEPGSWRLHVATTTNGKAEPIQDTVECLRAGELNDLGAYFAPALEDVEADCQTVRQPSADPRKLDHRMQCVGQGFTVDATTAVTIDSSEHFSAAIRMDSRTESESAQVVAEIEASRTGACEPPPAPPKP